MNLFRIHIKPDSDPKFSFDYCKRNKVLGMGWSVDHTGKSNLSWEEYIGMAERKYGRKEMMVVRYTKNNVKENDLVFTRDENGVYYLGRVTSPWEYLGNNESIKADMVNFFRLENLYPLSPDEVPGKVVACFRPSRTIQAIRNSRVINYSKLLWNKYTKSQRYPLDKNLRLNIFDCLDDKLTEDIVTVYLQTKGWLFVPGSRKKYTMKIEYFLINKESGELAVVQVKSGNTHLNRDEWSNNASKLQAKAILFQANGNYQGNNHQNVECIDPQKIMDFIDREQSIFPKEITHWNDYVNKKTKPCGAQ